MDERPTPLDTDMPGGFPVTPSVLSLSQSITPRSSEDHGELVLSELHSTPRQAAPPPAIVQTSRRSSTSSTSTTRAFQPASQDPEATPKKADNPVPIPVVVPAVAEGSAVPTANMDQNEKTPVAPASTPSPDSAHSISTRTSSEVSTMEREESRFVPLKAAPSSASQQRPGLTSRKSIQTEEDLFQVLSRRRTSATGKSEVEEEEEKAEIERLMSRMFGKARQEHSEEEKSRHVGVVFRDLTVKGLGLGAALQRTNGDIFLGLPRFLKGLVSNGAKAAAGKPPVRDLLSHFNGCIRPGEMLLVLGRPGSGCSTFLKVLGNQRFGYEDVEGDVTYGGTPAEQMAKNFRGEVLYNPEDDLHYATLTVKHTLEFALKTRTPGKESRNEGESRKDYIREFLRVVTKLFWIENTLSTKVGDEFVRGVSGGEKKRVSIAEAMITRASVQMWDNSTRGLDASTALEYVQSIRSLTNMAHVSTAVALYQAGESLYDLFDKVLLIDEGKCLYYGPSDNAKKYFQDLGFVCPDRWTTADFLTSVSDEHERSVKQGWEDRIPRSSDQFAAAYRESDAFQHNLDDMRSFEQELESHRRERLVKKPKQKNYTLPFHKQVWACTQRQVLVTLGDRASLVGKWGGIVFQGVIVGSLFFNMPKTSLGAFTRGGVLFFVLLFNALLALAEMTAAFSSKPILMKHKSFSFYRPAAYAIAQTVVDIPLVLIQVFLFNVIIYFMSGLQRTASQFFISILILWLVTMIMYSFFRMLAALCKSLDIASRFTGLAIQILVVYTGYLIPPWKMHPWFKWLMWINPVQYGFECLMANEFYNLEMQCVPPNLVPQGPQARPQYQSCTLQGSQPGQTIVQGANYINVAFGYKRSHLWRNFGFLWAFFFFFLALTVFGMEIMKPNAGGGAVTVFKRGQAPKKIEKNIETGGREAEDVESGKKAAETPSDSENSELKREATMSNVAKNESIFTYRDINYVIPFQGGERKLLSGVQGFVRPGRLTALMGSSGAGKTTLLNTLAQRINFGTVSGEFLVDGRPLPKSFQRATGFAEQMDVHEPTATVREALRFSALLRQPREIPTSEKYEYCERIIDLLEMRDIAGATIGKIGEGLNQEQRKRLTIAVELASKPELLMFLDEPTSGLDSAAAFNIVRFLRKLADAGQAILCTIHQPSAVLFEYFDELLLLKSGGRVVYHGDLGHDSRILIDYFENNGARKCPPDANPAEYMLDAIGAGNPDYKGKDWADVWQSSPEYQARSDEIADMIEKRSHVEPSKNLKDDREYAMPLGTQLSAVIKRTFVAYWRSPDYIVGKFLLHVITGLFNSFTFYHVGFSSIDMQSRLFSIFMTLTICPPLIQQLQPVFLNSRKIFSSRENNSKIYSWFAWTTASVLVELPYSIVAGGIYFICWWLPAIGRHVTPFVSGFTFIMLTLFELYYVGFGQAIASFAPNDLLASILVPLFFLFVVSFCGVVAPPASLPTFWRSWMYWVTPFHYLMEAMLGVAVHDQPVRCLPQEFARFHPPPGLSCQNYTAPYISRAGGYVQTAADGLCEFCAYASGDEFGSSFSVYYSNKWRDFAIFLAFVVFNFFVVFVSTWLRFKGKNPLKGLMAKRAQKSS